VLDTWFSSALWPFSSAGLAGRDHRTAPLLPDQCAGHRVRHLFFWVARMMMFGLYGWTAPALSTSSLCTAWSATSTAKDVKSFGNVVDPLDWIDRFGAEATRSPWPGAQPGRGRAGLRGVVPGSRNFCTSGGTRPGSR